PQFYSIKNPLIDSELHEHHRRNEDVVYVMVAIFDRWVHVNTKPGVRDNLHTSIPLPSIRFALPKSINVVVKMRSCSVSSNRRQHYLTSNNCQTRSFECNLEHVIHPCLFRGVISGYGDHTIMT